MGEDRTGSTRETLARLSVGTKVQEGLEKMASVVPEGMHGLQFPQLIHSEHCLARERGRRSASYWGVL